MKHPQTEGTGAGGRDFRTVQNYLSNYLGLGQKYTGKTAVRNTPYHVIKIPLKTKMVKSEAFCQDFKAVIKENTS